MSKYGTFKYGTFKYGDSPQYIFDRTAADLANNTAKAYINYTDLNRIESNMRALSDILNAHLYMNHIITKTDWVKVVDNQSMDNMPTKDKLERILKNANILANALVMVKELPKLPNSLENLDIYEANNLEKLLYQLKLFIVNIQNTYIYCGQAICEGIDI